MAPLQPYFSIIIVSYNSGHIIRNALASIGSGHQIIVVDNASIDNSTEIAAEFGAEVIKLEQNLGFGTACNRGAARSNSDVLLFLNPDAELKSNSLDKLRSTIEGLPDYAAFGLNIKTDGRSLFRQNTRLLIKKKLRRSPPPTGDCDTNMLSGAALAIKKPVFDAVGGFDENIFLYFEDDDLCARLVKAGHKLRYLFDNSVEHSEGTSTLPSPELLHFKTYHFTKAMLYTMRKHNQPVWRQFRIAKEYFRCFVSAKGSRKNIIAGARLAALSEKEL
jgi:N-acetylglucosaminyl-diphospho-decaprenol L-rhamnosyltransferase